MFFISRLISEDVVADYAIDSRRQTGEGANISIKPECQGAAGGLGVMKGWHSRPGRERDLSGLLGCFPQVLHRGDECVAASLPPLGSSLRKVRNGSRKQAHFKLHGHPDWRLLQR